LFASDTSDQSDQSAESSGTEHDAFSSYPPAGTQKVLKRGDQPIGAVRPSLALPHPTRYQANQTQEIEDQ